MCHAEVLAPSAVVFSIGRSDDVRAVWVNAHLFAFMRGRRSRMSIQVRSFRVQDTLLWSFSFVVLVTHRNSSLCDRPVPRSLETQTKQMHDYHSIQNGYRRI